MRSIRIQLLLAALYALFSHAAYADWTMIVPQKPGEGTSQWATIVKIELEKVLGERVNIKHIPGARDIAGFNKFHTEYRFDNKTMMVSHGGNGVSFIQERVEYNYFEYDSIGLQNLNIIMGIRRGVNPYAQPSDVSHASGSGHIPEGLAIGLLLAGPGHSLEEYIKLFSKNVNWVRGMSGSERRLAFRRGELTTTRENPAAFKTHVQPLIEKQEAKLWMHHGILDPRTGEHNDDPNFPPGYQFEKVFEKKWGQPPSGELYDAYKLIKSWRDGVQKAIWVNKNNPNRDKLRKALRKMLEIPESVAVIEKLVGKYQWIVGEEGNKHVSVLKSLINQKALKALVKFNREALGISSIYKPDLSN